MILATFITPAGEFRLAVVRRDAQILIDLQAAYRARHDTDHPALTGMQALIDSGNAGLALARELERTIEMQAECTVPLATVRLAAPLPCPPQMRDFSTFETHMRQAAVGMARLRGARQGSTQALPQPSDIVLPEAFTRQPLYYKTNRFSVVGHQHEVVWPSYSERFDYELEFGIVLGRGGRDIPRERAAEHIFGYTIFNDFSARDAQEFEMTAPFGPTKGKDFDTGNVLGPWIVTADELPNPYALRMTARINGEIWSDGNSRDMIHRFEDMIAHVSRDETLYPGEFFGSGTSGGGCGLELDRWLQPGDVVELEVEGIGVLRNRVVRPAVPD
ncbi:fumarylacetoacetate hydrolase family protein [Denitromonas iodatirespirans]|uniref:Fumarylacetoacetate hydrolase family protein n=1 Tax=Denitromonas iodatirespirans TaxID=2795389 RepID=A0A944HCG9_DENI1|nr:fumarylacetoacetate hydrolase family protein [Denitromonas iodatirespirans]MBT0961181.1 fumarylacetoacetate hydrolase family protein [Denitromonas iodatirespirans]